MSGPNSPNFSPLDYEVRGNVGVLIQAALEVKKGSLSLKCTLVNLVCERAICPRYERLLQVTADTCVSQRWTFGTFNVIIHLADTNCYI